MSDTIQFGEAARLYAENAQIVEAMRQEFNDAVRHFLDRLAAEAATMLPEPVHTHDMPASRYLWMAPTNADREAWAHLWLATNKPEIVHPGSLDFTCAAPRADQATLARLVGVASLPQFSGWCRKGSGKNWSVLTGTLKYTAGGPIAAPARQLADLLRALRAAETTTTVANLLPSPPSPLGNE